MGKLISILDFGTTYNPRLYFPEPEHIPYSVNGRGGYEPVSAAIEREYKFIALIQVEHLEPTSRWWIDLRKLVERQMEGDVIYWYNSLDYRWCWNREAAQNEYQRKYSNVRHGYWHFDFEFDSDRTVFALTYGEMISETESEETGGMEKAPKGEYQYGF